jgi:hypothetical protein
MTPTRTVLAENARRLIQFPCGCRHRIDVGDTPTTTPLRRCSSPCNATFTVTITRYERLPRAMRIVIDCTGQGALL